MEDKPKLSIVKIGGNVIDNPDALQQFLSDFSKIEGAKILVHGGGKLATKTAEGLGLKPLFSEGRRITDKPMLEIAVMTYAGWINKNIVATLQSFGSNSIGFSGADGNLIRADRRNPLPVDFGFVGDVTAVNATLLQALLLQQLVPVFSAITHDGKGQLLNTNADTIAAELAIASTPFFDVTLTYCFEKNGVLLDSENEDSIIEKLTFDYYCELRKNGTIHSGMLPKLENCFRAAAAGVSHIAIGSPEMLKQTNSSFTLITN